MAVAKPYALIRLGARFTLWQYGLFGMNPYWRGWRVLYTPIHHRLLGDFDGVWERARDNPQAFRTLAWIIRAGGVWTLALALVAVFAAAATLAND